MGLKILWAMCLAMCAMAFAGCSSEPPKYNYTFQGSTYTSPPPKAESQDVASSSAPPNEPATAPGNSQNASTTTTLSAADAADVVSQVIRDFGFSLGRTSSYFYATVEGTLSGASHPTGVLRFTARVEWKTRDETDIAFASNLDSAKFNFLLDEIRRKLSIAEKNSGPATTP